MYNSFAAGCSKIGDDVDEFTVPLPEGFVPDVSAIEVEKDEDEDEYDDLGDGVRSSDCFLSFGP